MKKHFYLFGICLIFFLGTFLRFYQLGEVPNSLNWDEVSWGYNAYAINQTGRDEHGEVFPLSFEAFGDYKQPVYVYLTAIAIEIFGLSPFSVRFSSALLGSLSILSVYFLVRTLFSKYKHVKTLSVLSMLFFAISPWSIQFSRVAYEANVASFFIITGCFFIIKGVQVQKIWLSVIGITILALSSFTYHSAKVFTPLLLLGVLVYSKYAYGLRYKKLIFYGIIFLLCSLVWIIDSRTTQRGRSVLFTSQQTQLLASSTGKIIYDREHNDPIGALLHNRRFVYGGTFLNNYLTHFDPNFLFIGDDNPRHHSPNMGVLYLASFPLIVVGIVSIIKKKILGFSLLLYWLFLAPIVSALAIQAPNASRSMTFLPTWDILAAFGFMSILTVRKRVMKIACMGLVSLFLLGNFFYYVYDYFSHTNYQNEYDWQYGYKEAVEFAEGYKDSGRNVFFQESFEQPYIFYLFYTQFPPSEFVKGGGLKKLSNSCQKFSHLYFGRCEISPQKGDIFISNSKGPSSQRFIKKDEIRFTDGTVAVTMYELH